MAVNSGGGAALYSGADYQARISAYLIVAGLCDLEPNFLSRKDISFLSFETSEAIDDINITFSDNSRAYIQAKAKIDYSTKPDSELSAVISQFTRQSINEACSDEYYYLATSSRSSRKITYDLKHCLEALRGNNLERFSKDQPSIIVSIAAEVFAVVKRIALTLGVNLDTDSAYEILRKCFVVIIDIDKSDPLEQAVLLVLAANNFSSPQPVWGMIVADCMSHAKHRRTIDLEDQFFKYIKYKSQVKTQNTNASENLLKFDFEKLEISCHKDVFLCEFDHQTDGKTLAVIETVRFEDDGSNRSTITNDSVQLPNGVQLKLLFRSATVVGMTRLIESQKDIIETYPKIVFSLLNEDSILSGQEIAKLHSISLKAALKRHPDLLQCLHCSKPISVHQANLIEQNSPNDLSVGLSHHDCLEPDDRVIGTISSEFFKQHPELINFDANKWFSAAQAGQIAFRNLEKVKKRSAVLVWGGERRVRGQVGDWVVEVVLENGHREFFTSCNNLDRFTKLEAESLADNFNEKIRKLSNIDPYCYSEQSKSSGVRSVLLEQIGSTERLFKAENFRVRRFDKKFAARYESFGSWYAPVVLIRNLENDKFLEILGKTVVITRPLDLKIFIDNWAENGVKLNNYELHSVFTDIDFDRLMYNLEQKDNVAVVDPMLKNALEFATGTPLMPLAFFQSKAAAGIISDDQILDWES